MRLVYRIMVYLVLGAVSSVLLAQIVAHRTGPLSFTPDHYMFYVQDRASYGNRWDYTFSSVVDLNEDHVTTPQGYGSGRFRNPDEIQLWLDEDPDTNRLIAWNDLPRWVRNSEDASKNIDTRFFAYGWPMRCLQNSANNANVGNLTVLSNHLYVLDLKRFGLPFEVRAPYGIIPAGFAVNAMVHGPAILLMLLIFNKLRALFRARKGLCPNCTYNLLHNHDAGCPECGWNVSAPETAHENTTEQRPVARV